ncbi:dTDP-glucose 4,6-dehydratase [Luteolibacter algae]|uniref:dTDP-glucose 4,6-dehydratase n=1 Tax=Luteolibacter algae TaxID=454151 RepID=A0ABW5DCA2_9BACT
MNDSPSRQRILVTGGAGFIGVNLIRKLLQNGHRVLNFDALTYAGNLSSLGECESHENYEFVHGDITDHDLLKSTISRFRPERIFHLAAESHVDRSIKDPLRFVKTNMLGTATLLEATLDFWQDMGKQEKGHFKFIHISTDEVFGSLGESGAFDESSKYFPRSPYSASKAGSDHLVAAWRETYGLPTIITNSSNNYGPYQYPEKLIPKVISNSIRQLPIPIYGTGSNIRDWIHVEDHCDALLLISEHGEIGASYAIGGSDEWSNLKLVRELCKILAGLSDEFPEYPALKNAVSGIRFVEDRLGHDFRYAIDSSKIKRELGWLPRWDSEKGFESTVRWYLQNKDWWEALAECNDSDRRRNK